MGWRRAVFLATLAAGCSSPPSSSLVVWYQPARLMVDAPGVTAADADRPQLLGDWDGWRPREGWTRVGSWQRLILDLPLGRYHYAFLVGEQVLPDPLVGPSVFVPDPLGRSTDPYSTEVSEVELAPPPSVAVDELQAQPSGLEARVRGATSVQLTSGATVMPVSLDGDRVSAAGLPPGKYTLTVTGAAASAAASVFVGDSTGSDGPRQLDDGLIYQVMIDRFRGPGGALAAPSSPGDRAGGTLDGVRAAIEAGYFAQLGVTTLWLSPVYQNPPGEHLGSGGHLYQSYHGYWPSEPRTVEPEFGGEAALDALVDSAHARGLRVIADAVPNHVYQSHPYYLAHSAAVAGAASWFNDGPSACVCGAADCDWGTHIESCWFSPELPDLNWRDPEVTAAGVGDLTWWMQRFDLDGLRIDAVPMMPRAASRGIAHAVRAQTTRGGLDSLILGEDYTGPSDEGRSEIRAYLDQKVDGLDSAFDFPLMWAARTAIAQRDTSFGFGALESEVAAGDAAWAGSGAVMAHMLDNHDTTRFSSEAAGDADGDPWTMAPPQSTDPAVYGSQLVGLTFMLTLPGLPVIYYGDEIALAGAGDPDSRRVLPDVLQPSSLPAQSAQLLAQVASLGRARACKTSLRRSERTLLWADADHDVSLRGDVLIVLSRDPQPATLTVPMLPGGRFHDVVSGAEVELGDNTLSVAPMTAAVWLPEGDSCIDK